MYIDINVYRYTCIYIHLFYLHPLNMIIYIYISLYTHIFWNWTLNTWKCIEDYNDIYIYIYIFTHIHNRGIAMGKLMLISKWGINMRIKPTISGDISWDTISPMWHSKDKVCCWGVNV